MRNFGHRETTPVIHVVGLKQETWASSATEAIIQNQAKHLFFGRLNIFFLHLSLLLNAVSVRQRQSFSQFPFELQFRLAANIDED